MSSQSVKSQHSSIFNSITIEFFKFLNSIWESIMNILTKEVSDDSSHLANRDQEENSSDVYYEEQAFYGLFRDHDSFQKAYGHSDNPLAD